MFSNNPKTVRLKGMPVEYNDSILHQNLVINDALSAIESTILFSFSNIPISLSPLLPPELGGTQAASAVNINTTTKKKDIILSLCFIKTSLPIRHYVILFRTPPLLCD
jgi:hypothetical protein